MGPRRQRLAGQPRLWALPGRPVRVDRQRGPAADLGLQRLDRAKLVLRPVHRRRHRRHGRHGRRVSATSTIQAEGYTSQSGVQTETTTDAGGGQDVGYIGDGDWLEYANLTFGSTPLTTFKARVASGAPAGVSGLVEVHLDSLTNPAIGSFAIGGTGGWQTWQTVPANITGTTGTHTVYLKFTTGAGQDFLNINWLTFS